MKHLFIALTISAASFFTPAKANTPITPTALESFRSTYVNAKDVYWTEVGSNYKVSFKLNGKPTTAFYTASGNWIGTTRNMSPLELSPKLDASLKKKLKAGYISDLFVVANEDGETYFVTITTPDVTKVYKSEHGMKWEFFRSIEK
jgi:hypothetical protein